MPVADASGFETFPGYLRLLTIIGDPITQARSPGLVNALLAGRGVDDIRMVPLQVPAANLATVVAGLRGTGNFFGSIVTMPHKEKILPLLDRLTPEASRVQACNVFRRDDDGALIGTMLDGEGFVGGLRKAGVDVAGMHVYMAGAGGAAAGIAHALAKYGADRLTIFNRTRDRAERLRRSLGDAWPSLRVDIGDVTPPTCEMAVNATKLGMTATDALPFNVDGLAPTALCADVVIRRDATPVLAAAQARGCRIHGGLAMLTEQIALMVDFMTAQRD